MCETSVINRSIVGLSKRSFARRIEFVASDVAVEKNAIARLNRSLDNLYELLYDSFPSITTEDYNSFSPYLQILIQTLNELIKAYRKSEVSQELKSGIERLGRNISALTEIDSDIRCFRINAKTNDRLNGLLRQLKVS